jgi:hypothetical protein
VLYLNGAEVWRDTNMPAGAISNTTPALVALAGIDETNWLSFDVSTANLVNGWNLLAAEVHQATLTSSDIGFDLALTGDALLGALPRLSIAAPANGFTLTWLTNASGFRVFGATNLSPPVVWQPVTNSPVLQSNAWRVDVPGSTTRFFRLQTP